jgi:hypothetical protein
METPGGFELGWLLRIPAMSVHRRGPVVHDFRRTTVRNLERCRCSPLSRNAAHRISRMGTFYEASAVKLQFRVIRHERQRSDMLLAACLDIRPGRKASDDLLSVTDHVGRSPHPVFALRRISANS